jgi:energy-coupling factor transporter ATP-binding protein EcfA2
LKELSPSQEARYSSVEATAGSLRREGCTPNTRVEVLKQLNGWVYDSGSQKIYWLNGMAGTGKTTIAYSLSELLEATSTLAASFFCSRQLPSCRSVKLILPTIAYQLARFSSPFRYALSGVLQLDPDIHTRKLSEQFEKLILSPLKEASGTMSPDLVIVIDALDECENHDGVSQILETLLQHTSDLPVKFFVTSRPEANILDRMRSRLGGHAPTELRLHELEHSIVREDIETYMRVNLVQIQLSDSQLRSLVDQAGVLFSDCVQRSENN